MELIIRYQFRGRQFLFVMNAPKKYFSELQKSGSLSIEIDLCCIQFNKNIEPISGPYHDQNPSGYLTYSIQLCFNVHILVMVTQSSYQVDCLSWTG